MAAVAPPPPPLELTRLVEGTSTPLLLVDPIRDEVLWANASAARFLGLAVDALIGHRFTRLHPGQVPVLIVFTQAVLDSGRYWTRDLAPRHATERELRVEYRGDCIDTEDGRRLVLLTLIDLDEQERHGVDNEADRFWTSGLAEWQRAERLFRDIERENQLILKAVGEGIYGVNAEGATTFVNPAAEALLGWKADEIVGRDMHQLVHHHHADGRPYANRECPIYAAFRDGAVHTVSDEVFWHKDGRPIPIEYTSTPIRDRGAVVGAVVVFRDVTRRKEAEDKLRGALEEVDRLRERLELENAYLQEEIRLGVSDRGIIGVSEAIEALRLQIGLVADTDATVLVTGESGTGKELIARAIHDASSRRERPLIRVNCAAIARDLFESEFFGHVRGAFTGALRDRIGRFELADGGTLFLDEVGEIPLELQGKLLRVLQEGTFERVGEEKTRTVDVRIIAATNRDLRAEIEQGRFRQDLFFRLSVFPIHSVPLRERPDDIPPLVQHFLSGPSRKGRPAVRVTQADIGHLQAYDWPGNVRELQNVLERAAILARGDRLVLDLPGSTTRSKVSRKAEAPELVQTEAQRKHTERDNLIAALRLTKGKVSGSDGAAALLGVKSTTLASRLRKLGIEAREYRR